MNWDSSLKTVEHGLGNVEILKWSCIWCWTNCINNKTYQSSTRRILDENHLWRYWGLNPPSMYLHSLGLWGGSIEPVPHILACCQGHHYHGGISCDPDVTEVSSMMSSSNLGFVCPLSGGSIVVMVMSSRNPDVTSSTITLYMLWGHATVQPNQLDDGCVGLSCFEIVALVIAHKTEIQFFITTTFIVSKITDCIYRSGSTRLITLIEDLIQVSNLIQLRLNHFYNWTNFCCQVNYDACMWMNSLGRNGNILVIMGKTYFSSSVIDLRYILCC